MKAPTADQLEQLADQRCAALLKRWIAGKKLNDDEKIEVHQRAAIPLDILSAGPSSPGAKEAVQRAQNTRKHAKYPKKLPEYAEIYGYKDERSIKRMIRRGKETGELPPLEEPSRMAAWWRRNMDHQVPDNFLGFADPTAATGDDRSPATSSGEPNPPAGIGARDFSKVQGLDLEQNVEGLRKTHAINKQLLDEALHANPPNDSLTQLRQKNFERSFELLRKGEITLLEYKKASGGLVDPEPIREEIAQAFESLKLIRETTTDRVLVAIENLMPRKFRRVLRLLEIYLRPAIDTVRIREEEIFRDLDSIDSPETLRKKLLSA